MTLSSVAASTDPPLRHALGAMRERVQNISLMKSQAGLYQACLGVSSPVNQLIETLLSKTRDVAIWSHYNLLVQRTPLSSFNVEVEFDSVLKRRSLCGAIVLRNTQVF